MHGGESEQPSLYRVVGDRFKSLESSYRKLKKRFERYGNGGGGGESCGWVGDGFYFTDSPHRGVLERMGHAVFVSRPHSQEIIYWNCAAEKLYGYKDYEILGESYSQLLVDKAHFVAEHYFENLSCGQPWAGQFPFKKRSGEIFMALVTNSSLYEDGELVGIITVSSDAAVFNRINPDNWRKNQDCGRSQSQPPNVDFEKIQWHARPHIVSLPQIASSVSSPASRVLSRKNGDYLRNVDTFSHNAIPEKPPLRKSALLKTRFGWSFGKTDTVVERSAKNEYTLESSQPSKLVGKVLSKLTFGKLGKDKDYSFQQNGITSTLAGNGMTSVLNSFGPLKMPTSYHCIVGDDCGEKNEDHCPFHARRRYANISKQIDPTDDEVFPREFNCFELPKQLDQLPNLRFQFELKELGPDTQKSKNFEVEDEPKQHSVPQKGRGVEEIICSNNERLTKKGDMGLNARGDCEIFWEDLQLREEIGQGAYAVVYRGIWNTSDVAVKVYFGDGYSEEVLLDFKKEVDILKKLRHPNVLLFMGAVYCQKNLAMVTEFLPRGSLFKTLHKNNQSLDIIRRLKMALDVARGMSYLHHRNPPIVHRDLKSSNLLVDKNWNVKVGDFGLSKLKHATFLTAKSGRGTPQWMAPEVLRNELSNEKSDVFSFGVVLWELMTQMIPWKDLNSLQVVGVVGFMDRRLDLPEGLDPRISSLICDCWQSNPGDRPSFKDMIKTMTDLIRSIQGPARRNLEL